jgi:hypothetical protein
MRELDLSPRAREWVAQVPAAAEPAGFVKQSEKAEVKSSS